jgi:acyl-CoA thioester hydrolase
MAATISLKGYARAKVSSQYPLAAIHCPRYQLRVQSRGVERFRFPIRATAADIDELGHVSNLVYLRWVLETATAHSAALGWGHAEYRALGAVFVVRRHEIDYLAQVMAGDEIVGETWVDTWKAASCVRRTELFRADKVVARAATTWAFIQTATGRPIRIPEQLRSLFTGASRP